jgi:hypothetical protein
LLLLLLQKRGKTDRVDIRGGWDRYTSIQWPNSSEGGSGEGGNKRGVRTMFCGLSPQPEKAETDRKERSRNTAGKGKSEMKRGGGGRSC